MDSEQPPYTLGHDRDEWQDIKKHLTNRPYLVLGLDPGISSCGFCLIDFNNHLILEMGSHLFKAPQQDKNNVSLAVVRRNARSTRRNNRRTAARLSHCLALLKEAGLVPNDVDKAWLQTRKGDKPVTKLRAVGLDRPLSDREFAQVLYSLCGKRGYIPHGEGRAGETDDAEGKKVLKAIADNTKAMESGGYRTVGEMLYRSDKGRSRNRGGNYDLCVYNSQIQDEVKVVFSAQRELGNNRATQELEKSYFECLTWEKKSADHDAKVYELVGPCTYFPEEKRAANADVSSELCRAYERLGHLVIVHEDGAEQTLTSEQIDKYIGILFSPSPIRGNKDCKVTYNTIRKDLDISAKSMFKGVAKEKEKDEVFAPKAWRKLRIILPTSLLTSMIEDRSFGDDICEAIAYSSTEETLSERLETIDLSEDDRETLLSVPFTSKLFKGYGNRSRKALDLLIGAFEEPEIRTLTEAEVATGLKGKRDEGRFPRSTLLPPYNAYDETCRNPVVLRAMGRMRRIINSIIKIYGVPDEIHVELARELKQSKREKDLATKRRNAREADNKRYAKLAADILGVEPEAVRGNIIRMLALREEQGCKDIYTGVRIDLERLVTDEHYCEIDHVLPYSRTCDDDQSNKTLTFASNNQNKRERTPYEWMTSDEEKAPNWEEYRNRVIAEVKNPRKRAKFLNTLLDEDTQEGFINRNLNDTRYMSRAVKSYLEDCLIFPKGRREKHVTAVAGGATGNLRWVWGLNFGAHGEKNRKDDRHHAVDAAVIAACNESAVMKVAKTTSMGREQFRKERKARLSNTQPWPTFADEVAAIRELVIPTRMVSHGVTGRMFEDTLYHIDDYTQDRGKYPLVRAKGKQNKGGNIRFISDDTAQKIDGIAFLRLWLDPDTPATGQTRGKWYAEPVYYADIPSIKHGDYVPRAIEQDVARINWQPIPESAKSSGPITVYPGDVVLVDNRAARFSKIGITKCQLTMLNLLSKERVTDWPSIGSWRQDTEVRVLGEDCLGHCYKHIAITRDSSTYRVE